MQTPGFTGSLKCLTWVFIRRKKKYIFSLILSKTSMFLAWLVLLLVCLAQLFISVKMALVEKHNFVWFYASKWNSPNWTMGEVQSSQTLPFGAVGSMRGRSLLAHCPQHSFTCLHEQTDGPENRSLGLLVAVQEFPLSLEDGALSCRILPVTWSH